MHPYPAAPTSRLRLRDGVELFCRDWGHGPPVVFLASWSLPGESWWYQMAALCEAGFRCLAYDRRGHGRSDDPWHGHDFDSLADDLAEVLAARDLREVTLVTFSAGAGEAVRYLTRHGTGRIARLAMIGPTTPLLARRDDNPGGIDPAIFTAFREEALRQDFPAWLAANARDFGGPGASQAMLDWVVALARQASPRALEALHRALTGTDFRAELPQLRLPLLVLQGGRDVTCPLPLTGVPTAQLVPGARLQVYDDAPHGLPFSHAARLNADLLAFARGA
jgi:pimeloyl-ACP methyl ester carboxylesterase